MRKLTILLACVFLSQIVFPQQYDTKKLETIATIWGESYLFHPSIIRADKNIEWEKNLLDFLPTIKTDMAIPEFMETINSNLLSKLHDPFTRVQALGNNPSPKNNMFQSNNNFDYLKISEKQLSDISSLSDINASILDRKSKKPLIIDLRIYSEITFDPHTNTFFDYFISMFIDEAIPLSLTVSREHFGWDEYNDWWFYEQRWKIANSDKQLNENGKLKPFKTYNNEIQHYLPHFNSDEFTTIERPLYLLTNNSFKSYFNSLLVALKTNKCDIHIINEDSGKIFIPGHSPLISYKLGDFEFILNSAFYINNGIVDANGNRTISSINEEQIIKSINLNDLNTNSNFSFEILPRKFEQINKDLSNEEKILGIIKLWTVVKYFYAHHNLSSANWNQLLGKYLELAQKTTSTKEYYILIQKMMAVLNDSHVSTFHPSILDFQKIFVAPIKFEWIEEKVIITAFDSIVKGDIKIGDEIISIDGVPIKKIIENEKIKISSSNRQGLISTVISTSYFTGEAGSTIKFTIKNSYGEHDLDVPRSTYVFQFMGFDNNKPESKITKNNIGYLNLALLTDAAKLESELLKMKNTNGLILDLRDSYPTADYNKILQLLCIKTSWARIDEVPIISAGMQYQKQFNITRSKILPDSLMTYANTIIVLTDKSMISRPEDICISLRAFPNVTFVGEKTQGTDGEMTRINLPGGGETSFTGQIVKFGDGKRFQGIGIIPDIEVKRSIIGVKKHKDEIYDKAIELLTKN